MWSWFYRFASSPTFYRWARPLIRFFGFSAALLFTYGFVGALFLAPADYQQGEAFRIIYVHVPSAFLSLALYTFMTVAAALSLIWRIKLAEILMRSSAVLGTWFTAIALVTGSLWGKPMWGTWWIWDARLTAELVLLFLFLGVIVLQHALPHERARSIAIPVWVLVGSVNLPIIHYSVYWWNTLHQGATLSRFAKPAMANNMLFPLLAMIAAFFCYTIAILLMRARTEILKRETNSAWVSSLII